MPSMDEEREVLIWRLHRGVLVDAARGGRAVLGLSMAGAPLLVVVLVAIAGLISGMTLATGDGE
jgi:hypothetical protein